MSETVTTRSRGWVVPFIVLGVLGLADATYLTAQKLTNGPLPCGSNTQSCEVVTSSSYSMIGPIPVAALGVLYYLTIVVLSFVALDTKQDVWLRRVAWLTATGFLFTLYLLYLQAFVLEAYCIYCLVSAGLSITLFLYGLVIIRTLTKSDRYGTLPHIQ